MKTRVYFSSLKNKKFNSPLLKITRLLDNCNIGGKYGKGDLVAIKIHFGELGNTSFIRPVYLRPVIDSLKKIGARPYLVDTNTLYIGMRTNSIDHLHNAVLNGFNYSTQQVPVIIADGLRGENTVSVKIGLEMQESVELASDIIHSDGMVVVSHFKGHEVSGFGGAIKNISMGCASRKGKLEMHSKTRPVVKSKDCIACGKCVWNCQVQAIELKEKAFITERCVGCARCIAVCPTGAVQLQWNQTSDTTQKKMVEYAYGTVKALKSKITYLNILTDMSPACDCYPGNDEPVTHNIGFLASEDPVAIDKASYDLVVKQAGGDPFKKEYPEINTTTQFDHAGKIGFGNLDYELVEVE